MVRLKHTRRALLPVILAAAVLLPACGKPEASADADPMLAGAAVEEQETAEENEETVILEPAVPAGGVGRIMPVVVEQRDELICIDPGHGFRDPGTGADSFFPEGIYEREISMQVSLLLDEALKARGFRTILTHDGETMPEGADLNWDGIFSAPYERPPYINNYIGPDYLVSIHVNAVGNPEKCGAMVFFDQNYYKLNDWNETAAAYIRDSIEDGIETTAVTQLVDSKEMEDASFAINRETKCASSLIEMGFCTNETDAENLQDPVWQKQMAEAIAEGIERFFDDLGQH
ncbi:MAG: N-acetylmuramoyl-L-alanine amidase [Clostridia bacterium]|nr:N-acetylmuramoyl-L-alanine amidase [Clostridia bacterium]MBO7405225.1 N-acetylmuramoyl-L-alanine amidase [Clostridia bacterium]